MSSSAHPPSVDEFHGNINQSPRCYICGEEADRPDIMVQLPCGHMWCRDCLNKTVMLSLRQRTMWPPFCCRTDQIEMDAMRPHLDNHVVYLIDQVREEFESENPIFCHVAQCSKFINVDTSNDQGQFVRCPKCHEFTCADCKAGKDKHVNSGECPDLITKEDRELAEKEGWKQCPNKRCQKLIEKAEGCPRMTCECGTLFCFECGRPIDKKDWQCSCLRPRNGDNGAALAAIWPWY